MDKKTNSKSKRTKTNKTAPKKIGRKGKYEQWLQQDNLEKVRDWRRNGATFEDLSKLMNVGCSTLKEWANKFPDFSDALKEAEVYDDQAEATLHKIGVEGWVTQEVVEEVLRKPDGTPILDENGNPRMVMTKRITKQIPPQTTALIFWLKCRRPDKWREKKDIIDVSEEAEYGTIEIPAITELEVPPDETDDMDTPT